MTHRLPDSARAYLEELDREVEILKDEIAFILAKYAPPPEHTVDFGPRCDTFAGLTGSVDQVRPTNHYGRSALEPCDEEVRVELGSFADQAEAGVAARMLDSIRVMGPHPDLPAAEAGVADEPNAPTGAERLAATLAQRTDPTTMRGHNPDALYLPEQVDHAIADVRTQVDREATERDARGMEIPGGNGDLVLQEEGRKRRRGAGAKFGKPCPKCDRRNGPRSHTCICGYAYYRGPAKTKKRARR